MMQYREQILAYAIQYKGDWYKMREAIKENKAWKMCIRDSPIHSPIVEKIEVVRHGKVRRNKLYYLRGRSGKAARIKEIR